MIRFLTLLGLFALALSAPQAQAQFSFLPYIGYNTNAGFDFEEENAEDASTGGFIVGVGFEFGLTPGILPVALKFRPSAETVFLPGEEDEDAELSQTLFQISGDLIAELGAPGAPIAPYAGVGITYLSYTVDIEGDGDFIGIGAEIDDSAVGLNVLGGVRFQGTFVSPFVQARYTLADPTPDLFESEGAEIGNGFSVMAGVSLGL
ncbi:MAG: outer membrane beta-barrel protein [Rhodothermales bacterium]|nr:outer membrane beta-barrel protein [Rhodothermales bacterium]